MAPLLSHRGLGSENGLLQPNLILAEKCKLTGRPGHTRAGAKQPTLHPPSTNAPKALCNLVPLDCPAPGATGSPSGLGTPKSANMAILGDQAG